MPQHKKTIPQPRRRERQAKPPHFPAAAAAVTAAAMETVATLVAHIQGLSGSGEELARLHNLLRPADGEPLRAHSAALLPFLAQLHPSAHSLGFLYLL